MKCMLLLNDEMRVTEGKKKNRDRGSVNVLTRNLLIKWKVIRHDYNVTQLTSTQPSVCCCCYFILIPGESEKVIG
jgi:hypothetical protein